MPFFFPAGKERKSKMMAWGERPIRLPFPVTEALAVMECSEKGVEGVRMRGTWTCSDGSGLILGNKEAGIRVSGG